MNNEFIIKLNKTDLKLLSNNELKCITKRSKPKSYTYPIKLFLVENAVVIGECICNKIQTYSGNNYKFMIESIRKYGSPHDLSNYYKYCTEYYIDTQNYCIENCIKANICKTFKCKCDRYRPYDKVPTSGFGIVDKIDK